VPDEGKARLAVQAMETGRFRTANKPCRNAVAREWPLPVFRRLQERPGAVKLTGLFIHLRETRMRTRWASLVLISLILTLAACGSAGDSEGSSASGGSDGDGAKWRIEYSGDLNGEVSGSIMSVVGIASNTTVAGGAMKEDRSGAADHEFRARILQLGDEPTVSFSLTLADGTRCTEPRQQDSQPTTLNLLDEAADTFRAEIRGTLYCGPERDQRIEYTAHLDAGA
jgi:hypothetical protein